MRMGPTGTPDRVERAFTHTLTPHGINYENTPDDYIEPLTHGDMQLWIATEDKKIIAALITQIIPYPQKKILRLISLAGDEFDKFKGCLDMVESFATSNHCTALEMWGRKGWKRLLPEWKDSYIVYTKDIKSRMQ